MVDDNIEAEANILTLFYSVCKYVPYIRRVKGVK